MDFLTFLVLLIACETPNCKCQNAEFCYCMGDLNKETGKYEAAGQFQIHKKYLEDANKELGTNYVWPRDAFHRLTSCKIVLGYMKRYATRQRLGRLPTAEDCARIHNGGLNGFKRDSTLDYLADFRKAAQANGLSSILQPIENIGPWEEIF